MSPGQAIELYLHYVVAMREEHPELPDVVLIKNSFFWPASACVSAA